MLAEKMKSPDAFWNVKDQEKAHLDKLDSQIDQIERSLGLAKRMAALAGAPGFQEYEEAVRGLEKATVDALLASDDPQEVMDGRARVRALRDILRLMTGRQEAIKVLASRLESLQNARKMVENPRPNNF